MKTFALATILVLWFSNGVRAATNGQDVIQCDAIESLKDFSYPADKKISLEKCKKNGGKLCKAGDQAMGGRWSKETLCYKGNLVVGGIKGTYEQGQNESSEK